VTALAAPKTDSGSVMPSIDLGALRVGEFRCHPDDPLWQRPTGLLLAVSGVLAFLLLLSTAH